MKKYRGFLMLAAIAGMLAVSCGPRGPEPISLNKDACDFCKMTIADGRFAGEIITQKGRAYKFDDLNCLSGYLNTTDSSAVKSCYISDFNGENELIDAAAAFFVKHGALRSPMGGNTAAFKLQADAAKVASDNKTIVLKWKDVHTGNHAADGKYNEQ